MYRPFYATTARWCSLESDVDRVELFRLTLRFFDDASEFSVTSLYVVFILSSKVMLIFFLLHNKSSVVAEMGNRLATIDIGRREGG